MVRELSSNILKGYDGWCICMKIIVLMYTIGSPNIDKIRIAKGVDQRFGRLDIVARVIDVLLDDAFRDLSKYLIVYIKSIEVAIHIDINIIDRKFYREIDLYNILIQCINRNTAYCSKIKTDFELLLEMLQTRYEVIVLSEEGDKISLDNIMANAIYVVGAEEDPPKNIISKYRKISIGPLVYHADQVIGYLTWVIKRRIKSGPIPA